MSQNHRRSQSMKPYEGVSHGVTDCLILGLVFAKVSDFF